MSARAAWRLEMLGFTRVFRYTAGKLDWLAAGLPSEGTAAATPRAGALATRSAPRCSPMDDVAAVRRRLLGTDWDVCAVVNAERVVLGQVRRERLEEREDGARVEDVMEPGPRTFRASTPPQRALEYMRKHRHASVLITTPDGELIGALRREDAEQAAGSE